MNEYLLTLPQGQLVGLLVSLSKRHPGLENEIMELTKQDSVSRKVYVSNLDYRTTSEALHRSFSAYGHIVEACVIFDKNVGRSRGFGDNLAAEMAVNERYRLIEGRLAESSWALRKEKEAMAGLGPQIQNTPSVYGVSPAMSQGVSPAMSQGVSPGMQQFMMQPQQFHGNSNMPHLNHHIRASSGGITGYNGLNNQMLGANSFSPSTSTASGLTNTSMSSGISNFYNSPSTNIISGSHNLSGMINSNNSMMAGNLANSHGISSNVGINGVSSIHSNLMSHQAPNHLPLEQSFTAYSNAFQHNVPVNNQYRGIGSFNLNCAPYDRMFRQEMISLTSPTSDSREYNSRSPESEAESLSSAVNSIATSNQTENSEILPSLMASLQVQSASE